MTSQTAKHPITKDDEKSITQIIGKKAARELITVLKGRG